MSRLLWFTFTLLMISTRAPHAGADSTSSLQFSPQFSENPVHETKNNRYRIKPLPSGVDRVEVFADRACRMMLSSVPIEKLRSSGWQIEIERVGAARMRVGWRSVLSNEATSPCADSGLVLEGPEGSELSLIFRGRESGGGLFEVIREEQLPVRIYRRLMGKPQDREWGRPIQLIGTKDPDRFVDPALKDGVAYEYKIEQEIDGVSRSRLLAMGSMLPAVESRGGVLIVVAAGLIKEIQGELAQLKADLKSEGWIPEVLESPEQHSALYLKIKSAYRESDHKLQALLLLGAVPRHPQSDLMYGVMKREGSSLDLSVGRIHLGDAAKTRAELNLNHAYRSAQDSADPIRLPVELRAKRSWRMDSMDLGSTLGYAQRLTATPSNKEDLILGDPTLRLHPVARPSHGKWSVGVGPSAFLKWKASPSAGVGSYWIYHSDGSPPKKVGQTVGDQHWYQHSTGFDPSKKNTFWIRAVRLEKSPSGTYINTSPLEEVTPQ